jgi:hypothetical protein
MALWQSGKQADAARVLQVAALKHYSTQHQQKEALVAAVWHLLTLQPRYTSLAPCELSLPV